jgi:O-methyltransferase
MSLALKTAINRFLGRFGYHIARGVAGATPPPVMPKDFDDADIALWRRIEPYTMTNPARVYSLRRAVEYIVRSGIQGDIVECGVWKGGSSMALALALQLCDDTSRELYLYDTYDSGWPAGGPQDVTVDGTTAHELWVQAVQRGESPDTLFAKYDNVAEVMKSTGYPFDKIHLVRGKVEDTIPGTMPGKIALLRLDTDWYESTKHEFEHLYPLLEPGGVLMVDDYGLWQGSREATDEYFAKHNIHMLLHRADDYGYRIGIKPH